VDPDPGGPKTCGSGGSTSATLVSCLKVVFIYFRRFNGLFSTPKYLFPRKILPATPSDVMKYNPVVKPADQLCDQVIIQGTKYRTGFLVICKAFSEDVLEVSEILKVILRNNTLLFLVTLSEAARNELGFFESLPSDTVSVVRYDSLADYKPIIKRGDNATFPFVLHHHVCPSTSDDGE
jgi:hypothetical protein